MARVVTKPKGPPYLLIVVIFLFLISTTLLVLTHMKLEEETKKRVDVEQKLSRLASPRDQQQGDIAQWMTSKENQTVVEKLADEKRRLIALIVPASQAGTTVDDVEARVKAAREFIGSKEPLVNEVETFKKELDNRTKEIKTVSDERDAENRKAKEKEDEAIKLAKKVEEMGAAFAAKEAALSSQIEKYQKAHEEKVAEIQKNWDSARDELNKSIASLTEKSAKMDASNKQKDAEIGKLQRRVKELEPSKAPTMALMPQPDGKVLKVLEGQNLCYINLGSRDRVIPGLTFSVYANGIPDSGEGKGQLTVTEVNDSISLCRIDRQDPGNPIIPNDVVANLVYDPNRAFTFVVEGQFDLFGTGQPTAAGTDEIKSLVRKYNGKLSDAVTAQTDFVVMGAEPPKPPKPADAASEQAKKVYEDQMKEWKHYQDVRNLATQMQIPILNTNRFLALIGYTPTKR